MPPTVSPELSYAALAFYPASARAGARTRRRRGSVGVIAGHARILAARQLGIAEIPVMVAAGWSEAQKRAYVLADNQLANAATGTGAPETR